MFSLNDQIENVLLLLIFLNKKNIIIINIITFYFTYFRFFYLT